MSKLDIIEDEIARRELETQAFKDAEVDLLAAIEQFNKLDEFYRDQEKDSREMLECIYLEDRHFTGEWPIVYQFGEVEKRPYFNQTDAECNPYFPITKVQDGTFDGIAPLFADPTRTGAFQRQRSFSPTEDVARLPALTELQNFPDISGEPLPVGWPGPQQSGPPYCSGGTYDEAQCLLDGGTWDSGTMQCTGVTEGQCTAGGGTWNGSGDLIPDPVWNGPDTAPALLRVALNAWRADILLIQADLCEEGTDEFDFWQAIVDDIDIVLPEIATDAVFVRATGNSDPAAWGQTQAFTGAVEDARARLETAADTGVSTHITARSAELATQAGQEEDVFFGLIKLRLHQANGSYSKLEASKTQLGQTADFITDNEEAIASLNLMKVRNS